MDVHAKTIRLLVALAASTIAFAADLPGVRAEQALKSLLTGNSRYTHQKATHPHQDAATRHVLVKGQHPPAIILGCADSRVPPELIFDQGLGDLFVVRVAGNVVDDDILGSIEYAVEHLGSRLIVVLGHERCGAVSAAVHSEGHDEGHVAAIIAALKPAVIAAKSQPGDPVANAVRENVKLVVSQIQHSEPVFAKAIKEGKIKVVGAQYSLDTGTVEVVK